MNTTPFQNKQYLVQIFQLCHYGKSFIEEKVVIGDEGITEYLKSLTFIQKIIDEILLNHVFKNSIDYIEVKEQNDDGSFDSYYEL